MKFMKLAEGSFHKFHMKWPLVLDPLFNISEKSLWKKYLQILLNGVYL